MFIHYSVIARLTRLITRLQVSSPFFLWSCRAPFVLAGALHTSLLVPVGVYHNNQRTTARKRCTSCREATKWTPNT